ncbi:glycosyltransferase family 2 protein [bacterium]|nr:glycosyltransferase family 2 protein [bacterium]
MQNQSTSSSTNQPSVSVFVPCFNEEKNIVRLLDSLANQTYPVADMEVLIVDGLSTDRTRALIEDYAAKVPSPEIRTIDNPFRFIPHALNIGVKNAQGDFLIRMDAHSIPAKDYVARCIEFLKDNPNSGVGGRIEIAVNDYGISYIGKSIGLAASNPLGSGGASYRSGGKAGSVDTVPFCAFTKETFTKVGNYDETLLANEDYEWNTRLRKSGGTVWFDPEICSVYFARGTLLALSQQYLNYGFWKFKMLKRYPETLRLRQFLPLALLSFLILATLLTVVGTVIGSPGLRWVAPFAFISYVGMLAAGVGVTISSTKWYLLPGVTLAIIVMHLSWAAGFFMSAFERIPKTQ